MGWQDRDYGSDQDHRRMVRPGMPVTLTGWVMGLTVVGFVLSVASERMVDLGVMRPGSVIPDLQAWRLASYPWMFAGFGDSLGLVLHLLFVLAMLWTFGRLAETFLSRGKWILTMVAGVLAGALAMEGLWKIAPQWFMGGIAGPYILVFALMGACVACAPRHGFHLFFLPITVELRWIVLFVSLISVLLVFKGSSDEMAHLIALATGYGIAKLRLPQRKFTFESLVSDIRDRNQAETLADHHAEVDRILAKIKREGMGKLTETEKRTLKRDTERLRK